MRRLLLKLVLLLLPAAIVNVAVAWGLALWLDSTNAPVSMTRVLNDSPSEWLAVQVSACRGASKVEMQWNSVAPEGSEALMSALPNWAPDLGEAPVTIADARGWPALALRCAHSPPGFQRFTDDTATGVQWGIDTGLEWDHAYPVPRILPLCPIWPGFAINTVFYALILWLLFAVPFALRRRRIKRGLCPKCAYDLRGTVSDACPECGNTVTDGCVRCAEPCIESPSQAPPRW